MNPVFAFNIRGGDKTTCGNKALLRPQLHCVITCSLQPSRLILPIRHLLSIELLILLFKLNIGNIVAMENDDPTASRSRKKINVSTTAWPCLQKYL